MTTDSDTQALLQAPSAAVLAVYRSDASVLMSPVWFRAMDAWIEIVIAEGDAKLERLRSDPRCVFMAFETAPPFRGLQVRADATLQTDGVLEARRAIAGRHLGPDAAERYIAARATPGVLVRLPLSAARTWDLRRILPP